MVTWKGQQNNNKAFLIKIVYQKSPILPDATLPLGKTHESKKYLNFWTNIVILKSFRI